MPYFRQILNVRLKVKGFSFGIFNIVIRLKIFKLIRGTVYCTFSVKIVVFGLNLDPFTGFPDDFDIRSLVRITDKQYTLAINPHCIMPRAKKLQLVTEETSLQFAG
jgi:hypothetical protein